MPNDEVKRLRAEVQKRIKSASAKIGRTKKSTGANLSGSEFDPRRRAGVENTYNKAQLTKYLGELNSFMRRTNQFVSGAKGAPLPRGQFALYKKAEAEYAKARLAHENLIGDLQLPSDMTDLNVRQMRAMVVESAGSSVYGPYQKFDRESTDIKNVGALSKLISDFNAKLKPDYLPGKINAGRENLLTVLEIMGEQGFEEEINALSDYQFDALWFGTNFAESAFMKYHAEKDRAAGTRKENWQDKRIDSAYADMGRLLSWAGNEVPRSAP